MAVYLTNNASYNVGTDNTFCNNLSDICTYNGGYAYAISNDYSRPLPSTIWGNVFVTGQNGVCGLAKTLVSGNNEISSQTSPELKELDEKYLYMLRKIRKDKEENKYDIKNYVQEYDQLVKEYKSLLKEGNEKWLIKAALSKISHLYKGKEDKQGFYNFIFETLADGKLKKVEPYLKRYLILDYIDKNQYDNSLKTADEILTLTDISEDLQTEMLYEKGVIYKYYLNDILQAEACFKELINKYPESILVHFAYVELGNNNGSSKGIIKSGEEKESTGSLAFDCSNYPNPFNPSTKISFELPMSGYTTLKVYDMLGREVAVLVDKELTSGSHSVNFNAANLASGTYIYQLNVNGTRITNKMVLLK